MEDKNNFEITINTTNGKPFDIPLQGSLGLLALGDVGLMAWRKKKLEAYQKMKNQDSEHLKGH